MQEKNKELAKKIAASELAFLEKRRGVQETEAEKRKKQELEMEKERIKDSLEWEIEKSELTKKWENNELDALHYYALTGDADSLVQRCNVIIAESQKRVELSQKDIKRDKMEIETKQKEEEGKEKEGI